MDKVLDEEKIQENERKENEIEAESSGKTAKTAEK